MLERAAAEPGYWRSGRVHSPPGDEIDAGGLSRHERAAQRSLYYVLQLAHPERITPRHAARGPAGGQLWSLQVDWGEPVTSPRRRFRRGGGERSRFAFVRVTSYALARRLAVGGPSSYVTNPGLRSRGSNPREVDEDDWQPKQGHQA